jgi:hypothetical protein
MPKIVEIRSISTGYPPIDRSGSVFLQSPAPQVYPSTLCSRLYTLPISQFIPIGMSAALPSARAKSNTIGMKIGLSSKKIDPLLIRCICADPCSILRRCAHGNALCSLLSALCSLLSALCSKLSALCLLLSALCSLLSALCPLLSALCPLLSALCLCSLLYALCPMPTIFA